MRLGIFGGGYGLDAHLPAFRSVGVDVVAICDSGSGRIQGRLAEKQLYVPSWRSLLDMDIDAVSVATPPALQEEILCSALARGKHVFCEKPFGATLAQAQEMARAAANAAHCTVAVNFQYRYERGLALLKSEVDAGTLGAIQFIDVSWLTSGRASRQSVWTWRNDVGDGGGVVGAFFSHAADLVCWISNSAPRLVFANTKILIPSRRDNADQVRPVTAEDALTAQIAMENETIATCRISNCQIGGEGMRVEVRGEKGTLIYRHAPPFAPEDQTLELRTAEGKKMLALPEAQQDGSIGSDSRVYALTRCMVDFLASAAGGNPSAALPSWRDGLRMQRMMDAVLASAHSGVSIALTQDV